MFKSLKKYFSEVLGILERSKLLLSILFFSQVFLFFATLLTGPPSGSHREFYLTGRSDQYRPIIAFATLFFPKIISEIVVIITSNLHFGLLSVYLSCTSTESMAKLLSVFYADGRNWQLLLFESIIPNYFFNLMALLLTMVGSLRMGWSSIGVIKQRKRTPEFNRSLKEIGYLLPLIAMFTFSSAVMEAWIGLPSWFNAGN